MILYDYFRSSCSFRVRIALHFKQLPFELSQVHLLNEGGEQHTSAYKQINAQSVVPTLLLDDAAEFKLGQSMAILEYLEEKFPQQPSLLPEPPEQRALVRQIANVIACDIQPLNNLRILQYLESELAIEKEQRNTWYQEWIMRGFSAIENLLIKQDSDLFCIGEQFSFAECCLIPQVYNAIRFNCYLDSYKKIMKVYQNALSLNPVKLAFPETC